MCRAVHSWHEKYFTLRIESILPKTLIFTTVSSDLQLAHESCIVLVFIRSFETRCSRRVLVPWAHLIQMCFSHAASTGKRSSANLSTIRVAWVFTRFHGSAWICTVWWIISVVDVNAYTCAWESEYSMCVSSAVCMWCGFTVSSFACVFTEISCVRHIRDTRSSEDEQTLLMCCQLQSVDCTQLCRTWSHRVIHAAS